MGTYLVIRTAASLALALWLTIAAAEASASEAVARIGDRTISLQELDAAGGRTLYDAAEQLHEARVRTLYQMLSTELLNREATARGMSVQQLIEQEITPKIPAVSEADLDAFLKAQGTAMTTDSRGRKQAQMYLGMKRQADAKREFVTQLFEKHKVRVSLAAPPEPPAEEILGPVEPLLGRVEAPVTIVAFSDYRCPYCKEVSHTLDRLLERFPTEVHVVYRHFPLHEESEALAHGALCAADQGKFTEYHRAVFATGAREASSIAETISVDGAAFQACMSEGRHKERIAADKHEGQRLKIAGTPTLFVAGQRMRGAQSLERLSASVQQALGAAAVASASPNTR